MTAKLDTKGITEYTYTGLSQLLTVLEPSGRHTEYAYDGAGNRLSEVVSENDSEITTTYAYAVNAAASCMLNDILRTAFSF